MTYNQPSFERGDTFSVGDRPNTHAERKDHAGNEADSRDQRTSSVGISKVTARGVDSQNEQITVKLSNDAVILLLR